jgi:predicted metal-binding membrane protein
MLVATQPQERISHRVASGRTRPEGFVAVSALLFAASVALTVSWSSSMPGMGAMPMPGGWAMSMMWMRMPGQSWFAGAASFVAMWTVMMAAMMLPSLVPALWRYRVRVGRSAESHLDRLTALAGTGYFLVWTVCGVVTFALGVALAAIAMQCPALARAVPTAKGVALLIAGGLQFTAWKRRHLSYCRSGAERAGEAAVDAVSAWRHGVRLGLHCSFSCVGLTGSLLAMGMMDLRAMAVIGAAITLERLAPADQRAVRVVGAAGIGSGVFLVTRALGLA